MKHFRRYLKTLVGFLKHYVVQDRVRDPYQNMQVSAVDPTWWYASIEDPDPNLQVSAANPDWWYRSIEDPDPNMQVSAADPAWWYESVEDPDPNFASLRCGFCLMIRIRRGSGSEAAGLSCGSCWMIRIRWGSGSESCKSQLQILHWWYRYRQISNTIFNLSIRYGRYRYRTHSFRIRSNKNKKKCSFLAFKMSYIITMPDETFWGTDCSGSIFHNPAKIPDPETQKCRLEMTFGGVSSCCRKERWSWSISNHSSAVLSAKLIALFEPIIAPSFWQNSWSEMISKVQKKTENIFTVAPFVYC